MHGVASGDRVQVSLPLTPSAIVRPETARDRVQQWANELRAVNNAALIVPSSCEVEGDGVLRLTYDAPDAIGPGAGATVLERAQRGAVMLREVASLLDVLHNMGAVHGALTRHSLWQRNGRTVLPDFGLVPYLQGVVAEPADVTAYWAPERWKGGELTPRSDQYALGVIAWELLIGRPRKASASEVGVVSVEAIELDMFTRLHAQNPPAALIALKRALSPEPAQRFPTCTEFATALADAVGAPNTPITASPAAGSTNGGIPWKAVAATALVIGAAAVAWIALQGR
jgi:hypothetical protein